MPKAQNKIISIMYPVAFSFASGQGIVAAAKRVRSTEGALDAAAADSPVFCPGKKCPQNWLCIFIFCHLPAKLSKPFFCEADKKRKESFLVL